MEKELALKEKNELIPSSFILETFNLSKSYFDVIALNDVSFQLNRGEIFGLVGPNGAGKTTLLKILSTLLKPDDGTAIIEGTKIEDKMAIRKIIGYTPDVLGVYDQLLVSEYLEFFVRAYYMEKELFQFLIDETMEIVGITELRDKPVEGLSRGMKQRLSLARAILHRPKLLLLDEPASGLDPLARLELRDILKSLRKRGVTILISSHVLSDLSDICDRIGIMQKGKMICIDRTENLLHNDDGIKVRLKIPEGGQNAMELLSGIQSVAEPLWDGNDIVFKFNDNFTKLSELNKTLVLADIPVLTLQLEEATLEKAYLDITKKEEQK